MQAYFDEDQHRIADGMGRVHPWSITKYADNGKYVDFKVRPALIEESLEDLRFISGPQMSDAIIEFLSWANGETAFETNDFGLRPLKPNESGVRPKKLEQHCRVTVFFRDLTLNVPSGRLMRFGWNLEERLKANDPEFLDACWGWCLWPHWFSQLGPQSENTEGDVLQLMLWSWGDSTAEVERNFVRSFQNLRVALPETFEGLKRHGLL